jgi:hypothetical protein
VKIWKPSRNRASCASTAHNQHLHRTAKQPAVNRMRLHGSLLVSAVNELSQGLPRVS